MLHQQFSAINLVLTKSINDGDNLTRRKPGASDKIGNKEDWDQILEYNFRNMESFIALLLIVSMGIALQTHGMTSRNFNQTYRGMHQPKNRPGKRNTKFIIPALISHMYRQRLEESPISTMLNRPFSKRVGKQDDRKRESGGLEHRTIVGNSKREGDVQNAPKTKSLITKTKEPPVVFEVHGKEETSKDRSRNSDANIDKERNVIQVSKHFSPLSRNWYGNPPTMLWPPPVPYPNSYGVPMEQYPRFLRPIYPGSFEQQEGFIRNNIIRPNQNKFLANNFKEDDPNKNLVAQERKFMVTNITKYVLDFYCPHCGGEISVSKNKNRGGIFGLEQGAISINKGRNESNESKPTSTTNSYSKETKTQQLN